MKPDTIRAWERRYGVPKPPRTAGGHRLYSQRDIDLLKWMSARQHEGLSASRVVDLWKSLEAEGKDPLQVTSQSLAAQSAQLGGAGELANLRREWASACTRFDEPRAEQIAMQAFALFPLENVVVDLLVRGLSEIGDSWHRGEATVQQEHFASMLVIRRLQTLIAASPAPTRAERIVLACPPEEQHTVSTQVINLCLRRQGWEAIDLGANVPLDRLESTLSALRPHLLISSAQHLPAAQTLQTMAESVTRLHLPFAFGGGVFNRHPDLRRRIAGHFLGESLTEIPDAVQQILRTPWPLPEVIETSREYLAAAQHYGERVAAIETDLMAQLDPSVREWVQKGGANAYFAQCLVAALKLGDLNFLDVDLIWVQGLFSRHHLSDEALRAYLQAYLGAAQKHLERRGQVIIEWLRQAAAEIGEMPE